MVFRTGSSIRGGGNRPGRSGGRFGRRQAAGFLPCSKRNRMVTYSPSLLFRMGQYHRIRKRSKEDHSLGLRHELHLQNGPAIESATAEYCPLLKPTQFSSVRTPSTSRSIQSKEPAKLAEQRPERTAATLQGYNMAARIFRGLSQLGKNIQLMKPLQEQVRTFSTSPTFGPSTPIISRTGLPFITPGFDFGHPPFGPHWGQSVTVGRDGLPLSVDWTKVPGAVWPAQDQGTTGLCTKFAALGSIASLNFLKTGSLDMKAAKSVVPSVQQVFDCNTLTSYGNFGGHPWAVLDFAINNGGILLAKLYPYTGVQGQCKCIKGRGVTIDGWLFIEPHNEKALKYALCYQPVIVSIRTECPMYVDGLCIDFDEYTGGIIKGRGYTSELLDHSVLCVGYDKDEDGNPYWICLNSLSIHWGQDGLFWLNRGSRQPGGALAILRKPLVPLKTSPNRIVTSKCESCGSCF